MNRKNIRMHVTWHKEEGFKLDIPYSGWLMFCIGLALLILALAFAVSSASWIRWW